VTLDVSSSGALGASLDGARRESDPYFNKLIRIMATRCMTQAVYFASGEVTPAEYSHYGLAAPLYTHFTSPIRRYADVLVHRLLGAALGLSALPASVADGAALAAVAANINVRHRNAQQAGRASVELHTLLFFRSRTVIADARVTRCRANGLIVFVPKYGIEGPVFFDEDDEDAADAGAPPPKKKAKSAAAAAAPAEEGAWELAADGCSVARRDGGQRFTLFDRVAVRIAVVTSTVARRERLTVRLADLAQLLPGEVARP
jgi:exosome complex exonuclease DIS3/RRP44